MACGDGPLMAPVMGPGAASQGRLFFGLPLLPLGGSPS